MTSIENHGVIYRMGLSPDVIREIAHSLALTGKTELAMSILTNSLHSQSEAHQFITSYLKSATNALIEKAKEAQ